MKIATTRFGTLSLDSDDIVCFPAGLPGLEECRRWMFLGDPWSDDFAWLQSIERPEVAMVVVNPRSYVADFELRATQRQLEPLELMATTDAAVLAIVNRQERGLTLNLKAPLVLNLPRRLGRQVIGNADWPLDYPITIESVVHRKSA